MSLGQQRERGEDCGGNDRFHVDPSGLPPHDLQLHDVVDHLRSVVHIALTARCEPDSRFVARLKDAERPEIKGNEEEKPPRQGNASQQQYGRDHDAGTKYRDAKYEPLALFARSQIRDAR